MKKIAAFLLIFATWYFAGMNRRGPMMAAMICAVIIIVVSFIMSRSMKKKVNVSIPPQNSFVYKDAQTPFCFHVENRNKLPVRHFRLSFSMKYRGSRRRIRKKLYGSASGARDNDSELSEFYFTAPYCGLIDVELQRIRIYDYFRLFSASKRIKESSSCIYVLPFAKKVRIDMPYLSSSIGEPNADVISSGPGDDLSEIRLVREYRDGDLIRHLHRNLSARSEKLWVKEYYRDNDRKINVYLDTSSSKDLSPAQLDAFYELVSSVLSSCSEYGLSLIINWLDAGTGEACKTELSSPEDIPALFSKLYRTDIRCTPEAFAAVFPFTENGMVLNTSLDWVFGGKPVFSFDRKTLSAQLESRVFSLGR